MVMDLKVLVKSFNREDRFHVMLGTLAKVFFRVRERVSRKLDIMNHIVYIYNL